MWHNNHTHKLNSKVMDKFTVESVVRGYHIYKTIWTPYIGEKLRFLLANISHRPANISFSTTHVLSHALNVVHMIHHARPFIATPISMSIYLDMGVYFLRCSYRMGIYSGMAFIQAGRLIKPIWYIHLTMIWNLKNESDEVELI